MYTENRNCKRFNPVGLNAHIVIDLPNGEEIVADGYVLDMSYNGIKIRLKRPLAYITEIAELRISLVLPESGITVSIHGNIKHVQQDHVFGLQYKHHHTENTLDNMMFECVKLTHDNVDVDEQDSNLTFKIS
ncbi:PilZ domain-containing protein [Methylomonas sp. AM2-LC]|uniref:PilZ domain-containing protein n=1 Tax=Methylomonas sp. AM2-LC TaxID=3153301 RepID=UPI003266169E